MSWTRGHRGDALWPLRTESWTFICQARAAWSERKGIDAAGMAKWPPSQTSRQEEYTDSSGRGRCTSRGLRIVDVKNPGLRSMYHVQRQSAVGNWSPYCDCQEQSYVASS